MGCGHNDCNFVISNVVLASICTMQYIRYIELPLGVLFKTLMNAKDQWVHLHIQLLWAKHCPGDWCIYNTSTHQLFPQMKLFYEYALLCFLVSPLLSNALSAHAINSQLGCSLVTQAEYATIFPVLKELLSQRRCVLDRLEPICFYLGSAVESLAAGFSPAC